MKRRFPIWLLVLIVLIAVIVISPWLPRITRGMPCANNNPGVCYSIGR